MTNLLSDPVIARAKRLIENGEPFNTTAAQFGMTPIELRLELVRLEAQEKNK